MVQQLLPAEKDKRRKFLFGAAFFILMACFFIFLYLFNRSIVITPLYESSGISFEKAQVTQILQDNLQEDGSRVGSQIVEVQILSGSLKGQTYEANSLDSYLYGAACKVGTRVIVQISVSGSDTSVSVFNYDRSSVLYLLVGVFVFLLWLFGGKNGLKSAAALAFSLVCILFLYLPMLYSGCSPFFAAVAVVAIATVFTFYMIGGPTIKTAASILSTITGVITAGLVATLFGYLGHLSGYNVSEVDTLIYISQNCSLDVGGLLFSGILISALGAAMENSFSIASAVNELYERTPSLSVKQLLESGLTIGRDMMSTAANTLIFAYAGGSVTVLIILYAYNYSYNQVINMYSIGIELLQALSATLGVIFTIPVCAAVSAWMLKKSQAKARQEAEEPKSA